MSDRVQSSFVEDRRSYFSDFFQFKANLSNILQSNVDAFESDSSADSMSFSWTLMHRKVRKSMKKNVDAFVIIDSSQ